MVVFLFSYNAIHNVVAALCVNALFARKGEGCASMHLPSINTGQVDQVFVVRLGQGDAHT